MKKSFLAGLVLTLCTFTLFAEVRKADSLKPIEEELNKSGKRTLVLLDMGGTLMVHKDAVLNAAHEEWKRAWYRSNNPVYKREDLVITQRITEGGIENWKLVDENWPSLIANAQMRGAKVVALTKVIIDPSLTGLRVRNLHTLGIPIRDDLAGLTSGVTYIYGDGIIETEANLKGPVVREFLPKLKERPGKIVFVDDRLEQVKSVDFACQQAGIPCVCFHYIVALANAPKLDEKIAEYQLRTLLQERRWISEAGAREEIAIKSKTAQGSTGEGRS